MTEARTTFAPHAYVPRDANPLAPCEVCMYGPRNPIHLQEPVVPKHRMVFEFDRDSLDVKIVCPHTGPDRPCAPLEEAVWPDDNTCRCEDAECPCRQNNHGECAEFGTWIDPVGWECRCQKMDACFAVEAVDMAGWDEVLSGGARASVEVELVYSGWEEPIEVRMADCSDGHDWQPTISKRVMRCSRCPASTYDGAL